jgi:hypothetical protein
MVVVLKRRSIHRCAHLSLAPDNIKTWNSYSAQRTHHRLATENSRDLISVKSSRHKKIERDNGLFSSNVKSYESAKLNSKLTLLALQRHFSPSGKGATQRQRCNIEDAQTCGNNLVLDHLLDQASEQHRGISDPDAKVQHRSANLWK